MLPDSLADALSATPQTGEGYWIVVVRLWDGREVGGIGVVDGAIVQAPFPIETREIIAIGLETGDWIQLDAVDYSATLGPSPLPSSPRGPLWGWYGPAPSSFVPP